MSHRTRISLELAIALAILAPVTVAQKPPAPTPPPTAPPTRPSSLPSPGSQPNQPYEEVVLFLRGRVATNDNTALPHDVLVERVCNQRVRQQVHATSQGDFSMQLGSKEDPVMDATGDQSSGYGATQRDSIMGIPRRSLTNCEIRASTSGFFSGSVNLMDLDPVGGNVDVGRIVMRRATKIEGLTLSATPYKAPPDARKAYEQGVQAERAGKLATARSFYETAVHLYPRYTSAWFQLATVLRAENQKDAARNAFMEATKINPAYLPPYVSLASMAYQEENWTEVLSFSGHVLEIDSPSHADGTGLLVDLDPWSCNQAYFYNAVANYKLNRIDDAERIGLRAEHLDLFTEFPQIHLLLADIYRQKNNYAKAIGEIKTYLELAPRAKNVERLQQQLAQLEILNGSALATEKLNKN